MWFSDHARAPDGTRRVGSLKKPGIDRFDDPMVLEWRTYLKLTNDPRSPGTASNAAAVVTPRLKARLRSALARRPTRVGI